MFYWKFSKNFGVAFFQNTKGRSFQKFKQPFLQRTNGDLCWLNGKSQRNKYLQQSDTDAEGLSTRKNNEIYWP